MQSRGWRLEEEGQAGPSPASVHSPLALSAPRPDGLPRSLVSEDKAVLLGSWSCTWNRALCGRLLSLQSQ